MSGQCRIDQEGSLRRLLFLVVTGFALCVGKAQAQQEMHPSALYLLGLCDGKEDAALAYIVGWIDRQQYDTDPNGICYPNGMRPQWARDVLCEYIATKAKNLTLNMNADQAMWSAMHSTWPCNE